MLRYHRPIKTVLYISVLTGLSLFASCNNSTDNECTKNEQLLQEQIRVKDARISRLEDSLKELGKGLLVTDTTSSDSAGTAFLAMENSLFKEGTNKTTKASKHGAVSSEMQKKYPGQFPEGSARVLTDKDLKFLSEWGLKVMLNEIYARHGMLFTDDAMQKHFNHSNWYHGTSKDVDNKLTKTEKQNIRLIRNYKFTPQIPT